MRYKSRRSWLPLMGGLLLGAAITAATWGIASAGIIELHPYSRQPITVCYQSDGVQVTTAYIDSGAEPWDYAYPGPDAVGSASIVSDTLTITHTARLTRIRGRVYLPVVRR